MSVPPDKPSHPEITIPSEDVKPALRRTLLAKRDSLDEEQKKRWDLAISQSLQRHLKTQAFSSLGIYFATRNEPDLMALYVALSAQGVALSLPVVVKKATPMQFASWQPGDPLTTDRMGISVPEKKEFVALPQALLVPCLGFTQERFRLGYGGGYFDRTLEKSPRPHTIGISYACLETVFPIQSYDIPLDAIITESTIL